MRHLGAFARQRKKIDQPVPVKVPSVTYSEYCAHTEGFRTIISRFMTAEKTCAHKFLVYVGALKGATVMAVIMTIDNGENRLTRKVSVRVGYTLLEIREDLNAGSRIEISLVLPQGKPEATMAKAHDVWVSFLLTANCSADGRKFAVVYEADDIDVKIEIEEKHLLGIDPNALIGTKNATV